MGPSLLSPTKTEFISTPFYVKRINMRVAIFQIRKVSETTQEDENKELKSNKNTNEELSIIPRRRGRGWCDVT